MRSIINRNIILVIEDYILSLVRPLVKSSSIIYIMYPLINYAIIILSLYLIIATINNLDGRLHHIKMNGELVSLEHSLRATGFMSA